MSAQAQSRPIDQEKLNALLGRAVQDMGAALHAALIVIGDRLGLYRAMADGTPLTPAELAARTGTAERYVREWLNANAAGNYVEYHADSGTYSMTPEQAFAFALDDTPVHLPGFYHMLASCMKDEEKLTETFRTGKGFGWHEHEKGLFEGCERFFRPNYLANLTTNWIPALDGVEEKLRRGARVADVGCGHGASTLLMAKAYPASRFYGFDYHPASIERARRQAEHAGLAGRVTFEIAPAKEFPGSDYDLVAFFDCLHDMGDPVGAARDKQRVAIRGHIPDAGVERSGRGAGEVPFRHVPKHQDAPRSRRTCDGRGDPRRRAAVRSQGECYRAPSRRNEEAFNAAVDDVAHASRRLLDAVTNPSA